MLNVLIDVMINAGAFLKSLNHPLTPQPPGGGLRTGKKAKSPLGDLVVKKRKMLLASLWRKKNL